MIPLTVGKAGRSGHAGLALLLTLSAACGRMGIGASKLDGGTRIPDGASAGIPDGASAGIPDGASAGIPDGAVNPDSALTVCEPPPTPSCLTGPIGEVALTTLGYWDIMGLVPVGEEVFFAIRDNDSPTPAGRITRLALRTRETQSFDLSGAPVFLRYQARSVLYGPAFPHPSEAYSSLVPNVVRWDLQTGDRNDVPQPPEYQNPDVESLAVNSRGEIFWILKVADRKAIAKWSPCSQKTELLVEGRGAWFVFADDTTVYWQEAKRAEAGPLPIQTLLYSMPSAGGAATLLATVFTNAWNETILLGIDERRLYYMDPDQGLMAMPKQGGDPQLVITKPWLLWWAFDETNIYWVDSREQSTLRRTSKQGGPTESLWISPNEGSIRAVAVDACNVYWFAVNPMTLRYRAK
jgi:hypothetical protein